MSPRAERLGLLSRVELPSGWKRFLPRRRKKEPAAEVAKSALDAAPREQRTRSRGLLRFWKKHSAMVAPSNDPALAVSGRPGPNNPFFEPGEWDRIQQQREVLDEPLSVERVESAALPALGQKKGVRCK